MFRIFIFLGLIASTLHALEPKSCAAGLRFQKTLELYWENGIEARCQLPQTWSKWSVGATVISSRIGSAFQSNAIEQETYWIWLDRKFRADKRIQPYTALGTGYFWLDVENPEIFSDLPNSSWLLTLEGGVQAQLPLPWLQVRSGIGYHLITGDGTTGPGTLYPLYFHLNAEVLFPW